MKKKAMEMDEVLPISEGGYGESRLDGEDEVSIVYPDTKMVVRSVPENDGQTMMTKKFSGAAKPWKPIGRK